eukprot:3992281-Prymnesium_polylepis.1
MASYVLVAWERAVGGRASAQISRRVGSRRGTSGRARAAQKRKAQTAARLVRAPLLTSHSTC